MDMAVLGNSIGDLAADDERHTREGASTRSSSSSSRRDSLPMPPPRHNITPYSDNQQPYQLRQPPPGHRAGQQNPPGQFNQAQNPPGPRNPTQPTQQNPPGQYNLPQNPSGQRNTVQPNGPGLNQPSNLPGQRHIAPTVQPNAPAQYPSNYNQMSQNQGRQPAPYPHGSLVHQTQSVPTRRQDLVHQSYSMPTQGRQMPQIPRMHQNPTQDQNSSQNYPTQNIQRENLNQLESSPESRAYDRRSDQYSQNESDYDSLERNTNHSLERNTDSLERNLNQPEPNKVVTKAVLVSGGGVETLTTSPEPRRSIFSFEEQRASPALLTRAAAPPGGTPGGRSARDDGYSSAGSTPLSIGHHKPTKHGSVVTLSCYKKEPKVQIEEEKYLKDNSIPVRNYNLKNGVDDGRETWGTGADFLLSIIGFAVDLANVWRFPYLCYRNGGGAFLIPYTLMLVFGAMPLFYMELILGQYNRQGPISLWKICPLFKGVGFCAVMVAFYVSFYYNVIIGWAFYFLVSSARTELPWIHCDNSWNTEKCWDGAGANATNSTNRTDLSHYQGPLSHFTPASEFFHRAVLEMQHSEGLNDLGLPKWQLVVCLGAVYFTLYLSLFKGVKSSGKVVWATATLPYVVLSILLVRGLLLPGAARGIAYYLQPELQRLKDTQVWVDAAVQIFYSVGAGFGVHLSYASYNTFHNNCYRDCLVTTLVNCFTSFFSGFVIFTYLGFMSHKQGVPISAVATEGPGLVFQVYPEAVATLPGASIWAMLFFFMLIMLGLDSGMGGLECVITGLLDEARACGAHWLRREHFTLLVVCISFCVACINVTPGGIYMFHLLDTYAAGISLLCSALFEAVAVSWFYGLERFSDDVEEMLGFRPGLYWRICWKFVSPIFIIGVVVFGLLYQQPLQYQQYLYPEWAAALGWSLALSSILMIPACAAYKLLTTPGSCRQIVHRAMASYNALLKPKKNIRKDCDSKFEALEPKIDDLTERRRHV